MKVRKTITMDSVIAGVLDANCTRHGDVTWHVENALTAYFKELSKPKRESKKVARFEPPTYIEVSEFFIVKGSNPFEAEKYFNYYESNGWKVGKNKMKNWNSSASGWISRNKGNGDSYGRPKKTSLAERSATATEQIFAQIDAEEASSGFLESDGESLRLQVDEQRG